MSSPLRRRGLKFLYRQQVLTLRLVVSLAETWIEIKINRLADMAGIVVSLAETWIEIFLQSFLIYF